MLVDALAGLPGIALALAAGIGVQALVPAPLERGLTARLGYAFLLGVAWLALIAWALSFVLSAALGRSLFLAVGAAPLAAGAAAVARRRAAVSRPGEPAVRGSAAPPRGWSWLAAAPLALVVGAASVALLVNAASEPVSDFDGRMTWGTAAKYLLADGSVLPPALGDADAYVIHPRYPILMPLVQVLVAAVGSTSIESAAIRPVYVLFLPALAAIAWPPARRAGGILGAALATTLVFASPMLLWHKEGGANGTYSDLPLAALLGAGIAVLAHPRAGSQRWRGAVAGLLLAAAAGTKNEGIALAGAVALAALVAAWRARSRDGSEPGHADGRTTRRAATPLVALLTLLAGIVLVFAWRSEIPNRNDEAYFEQVSAVAIARGLVERGPMLAEQVAHRTFDTGSWGLLFFVAPLLLGLGWRSLRGPGVAMTVAAVGTELVQVLAAYAVVPDPWILDVTWNRFVVQLAMPLVLLLSAASGRTLAEAGWAPLERVAPARAVA